MKVYISADMEGITGVTHWDEVDQHKPSYPRFQKQMSLEVAAACEGAKKGGATEVWVKDAHDSGRNILPEYLPGGVKLIRGWSGHPYSMVQELDYSFDALVLIGYHSRAGQGGNPLAHTMSSSKVESIYLNDMQTSEFLLHAYVAGKHKVPIAFLSVDVGLCEEVLKIIPNISTHATMIGIGNSTISIHPQESVEQIESKVAICLKKDFSNNLLEVPKSFEIKIKFNKAQSAYSASHYLDAKQLDPKTVAFVANDYDDIMRFIHFVI